MAHETYEEAIQSMLTRINEPRSDGKTFCEKAAGLFAFNKWTWHDVEQPTAHDIAAMLSRLAYTAQASLEANDRMNACCSTGRLQVRVTKWDSGWYAIAEIVPDWCESA